MDLNGWDMYDIGKKLSNKTIFEILSMYKEKDEELNKKSIEYLQALNDKNEAAKKRIEEECSHLSKEKCVIAIKIADEFTKENKK